MGKRLTLKKAKELSDKKWTLIVNNDGKEPENLLEVLPELEYMINECAMCQLYIGKGRSCTSCLYDGICQKPYTKWLEQQDKESAFMVLTAIRKANKK